MAREPKQGAEQELVELHHEFKGDWTLSIEGANYEVVAGVVKVPVFHVPAAMIAGFRPAA